MFGVKRTRTERRPSLGRTRRFCAALHCVCAPTQHGTDGSAPTDAARPINCDASLQGASSPAPTQILSSSKKSSSVRAHSHASHAFSFDVRLIAQTATARLRFLLAMGHLIVLCCTVPQDIVWASQSRCRCGSASPGEVDGVGTHSAARARCHGTGQVARTCDEGSHQRYIRGRMNGY